MTGVTHEDLADAISTVAERAGAVEQKMGALADHMEAMDAKVGELKDMIEAWQAVRTMGKFIKWFGAVAAGLAAIFVMLKMGFGMIWIGGGK